MCANTSCPSCCYTSPRLSWVIKQTFALCIYFSVIASKIYSMYEAEKLCKDYPKPFWCTSLSEFNSSINYLQCLWKTHQTAQLKKCFIFSKPYADWIWILCPIKAVQSKRCLEISLAVIRGKSFAGRKQGSIMRSLKNTCFNFAETIKTRV